MPFTIHAIVEVVEVRKPYLSLGKRVGVGLGFWAVGTCGLVGTAMSIGDTMGTKFARYGAELNDRPRAEEVYEARLHEQQAQVWANLASGAAALAVGAALTRGMEKLWSGPLYGQEAAPTGVDWVTVGNVTYADFGNHVA